VWNKDQSSEPMSSSTPSERPVPHNEAVGSKRGSEGPATIGRSIVVKGEVSGDEDLLIQGRIEGSVDLEKHTVTVGPDGHVKADITGRHVTVEGRVEGDLRALEQVVLRASAKVQGDITAPRVVLEDGAAFKGGVDMGELFKTEERSSSARSSDKASSSDRNRSETSSANGTSLDTSKKQDPKDKAEKSSGSRTEEPTAVAN
jgi:cytoskeletal protein CcmA (bactofilin family)